MSTSTHLDKLKDDISHFLTMSQEEFFDLDFTAVEAVQLAHLRARFRELRPKIRMLDRLATEVGLDDIRDWADVVPLSLPHTIYKGYAASDVENGRWDRLTRWVGGLTACDPTGVDMSGCASLDDWIGRLEGATPLRFVTSSGTSGKISIFPRERSFEPAWCHAVVSFLSPYRGETGVDFASGDVPILCPVPFDDGHQSTPTLLRTLRDHLYGGRAGMIVTQQQATMLVQEQWLMAKVAKANASSEELVLSESERAIVQSLARRREAAPDLMARFVRRAVEDFRGRPIAFLAGWPQLHDFALTCDALGLRPDWAPGSVFFVGGGNKGVSLPEGWRDTVEAVIPTERFALKQMYGMSESTVISVRCGEDHLHPFPWGVFQLVDPDTSELLPRRGVQTGRIMAFDLMPRGIWAGLLVGDEATIHWDGGCPCGRNGPYFLNRIRRFAESRGGDDKISCVRAPDAYQRLADYAVSDVI